MNHAVTIKDLLFTIAAFAGFVASGIGGLMVMAGAMSDAGDDGTSGRGCGILVVGAAVLIGSIIGIFL